MNAVDYKSASVPVGYLCSKCGADGCKLWRQYQTFLDRIDLLCLPCAEKDQKEESKLEQGGHDAIGWLVPAIPIQDGSTFWGYTSVPLDGCDWWDGLPNRPGERPPLEGLSKYLLHRFQSMKLSRDYLQDELRKLAAEVVQSASGKKLIRYAESMLRLVGEARR